MAPPLGVMRSYGRPWVVGDAEDGATWPAPGQPSCLAPRPTPVRRRSREDHPAEEADALGADGGELRADRRRLWRGPQPLRGLSGLGAEIAAALARKLSFFESRPRTELAMLCVRLDRWSCLLQTLRWFYNFDSGVGGNPISAQLVALPMISRAR